MEDAPAYMQPDFDANTLRVAELRGILVEHDIDYPSSAKKAQLVELFNEHVAPRTKRLLGARSKVKASSRGIVNAENNFTTDDEVQSAVSATPAKRTRRTRASMAPSESADERATPARSVASTRATPARSTRSSMGPPPSTKRVSGAAGRTSMSREPESATEAAVEEVEEPTPKPRTRKPRKSLTKLIEGGSLPDDSSEDEVFTKENPFQAGSPTPPIKSPEVSSRRKTMLDVSPVKRSVSPRKSLPPNAYASPSPAPEENRRQSTRIFNIPLSVAQDERALAKLKEEVDMSEEQEDTLLAGEEFVPEEAAELEDADRSALAMPSRRSGAGGAMKSLLAFVLLTIASAFFIWWRKEKIMVGYCGVGSFDGPVGEVTWDNFYLPRCEPCPAHAICKPGFEVECKDDYVLTPNKFELFGLIPLPPTCEPDSDKLRKIAVLSNEAVHALRQRAADVECGKVKLKKGDEAGISEEDLKQRIYEIKSPKLSDAQFNELWRNALEDVTTRDEVVVTHKEESPDKSGSTPFNETHAAGAYYRSTSLSAVPFTCAIKLTFRAAVARYRIAITGLILAIFTYFYIRRWWNEKAEMNRQIKRLVHITYQTLAKQQRLHNQDPERWKDSYIAIVHLRDQVLQYEFDPKRREKLWEGVRKVVELNSNVRVSMREVQGEVMKCWSWVGGSVPQDDDMPTSPTSPTGAFNASLTAPDAVGSAKPSSFNRAGGFLTKRIIA